MTQPCILVVGNSFSSLRSYLEGHNFDYVVLKDAALTKFPDKIFKHRVVCDFSDMSGVLKAVDEIVATKTIDGVFCTYEQFIGAASEIAHHLGLPALPKEAAVACTDKFVMRTQFAKAPEKISPEFAVVANEQTLRNFAASHSFPLIIKPANLSKSLLVSKSDSLEELLLNYQNALENMGRVYKKYAPHATPKLLVEEFMEGSVHSVDAFVDKHGKPFVLDAIVDYETGHDIGYADNFTYSRLLPSQLSDKDQAAVKHVASLGVQALGMKNTAAHIEIIVTSDGPRIVEIGARNGGYRERMHAIANGIDILANALKLSLGQEPDITATKNESMGVFELFPKEPGIFEGLENEKKLLELPSLARLAIKVKPGTFVGKASDGYKMCAIVFLHNKDANEFQRDMAFLNHQVRVITR
ncbi:MAG TPA: ATP-grasp domain-containing protein [Candidatus Saccharimonadales bacterium]|nr:ATP-grasp domain-containing protein [Candidatus Saccharimonadales bacterium]